MDQNSKKYAQELKRVESLKQEENDVNAPNDEKPAVQNSSRQNSRRELSELVIPKPSDNNVKKEVVEEAETPRDHKAGGRKRPKADFMSDDQLDEKIVCPQCGEELVKAFQNDHICDPSKQKNDEQIQPVAALAEEDRPQNDRISLDRV